MLSPSLNKKCFGHTFNSFLFFGIIGFLIGTISGICLCYILQLSVKVILLMTLVGVMTFFTLAIVAKIITGTETIVYYHHEIAILLLAAIVLKALHLPVLTYLDVTILGIAVFLAFGRMGCFSVGCCHGRPARLGVVYGREHVQAGFTSYFEGIPLLPVQLIESIFVFIVVIIGCFLLLNHYVGGTVLIFYTVVYGSFRFAIEFIRGDPERHYWKGLSEAQWTTLVLLLVSLVLGLSGVIPLYIWHLIIVGLVFGATIFVLIIKNSQPDIFNTRHIKQIALVLKERDDTTLENGDNILHSVVCVYQTNKGLYFSKGRAETTEFIRINYTVSLKNKQSLNYNIVGKLAKLIQRLQKHKSTYQIIESQNGIFHIVFSENKSQKSNIVLV